MLVTGAAGSGKSSTLAVLLDAINREKYYHIITIEDPIEFLHNHKCSTIHQRELHSDTPSFAHALRSAMRQAPKVILVGEMRDRETIGIVLQAAETLGTWYSPASIPWTLPKQWSASLLRFRPPNSSRCATFRQVVPLTACQRLMSKHDRSGRAAAFEILKANARTRECIERGERENRSLLDAMKAGATEGMQHFDGEIAKLVQDRVIHLEPACLSLATLRSRSGIGALDSPGVTQASRPRACPTFPPPPSDGEPAWRLPRSIAGCSGLILNRATTGPAALPFPPIHSQPSAGHVPRLRYRVPPGRRLQYCA